MRARYLAQGLSQYDVLVLADDLAVSRYMDAVLAAGAPPKPSANWVMGDVMAHCKEARVAWDALPMAPAALAEMIGLIEDGTISGKIGKELLPALLAGEGGAGAGSVRALVEARGLVQISDPAALEAIVDGVLAANAKQLQQYREGAATGGAGAGAGLLLRGCCAAAVCGHFHTVSAPVLPRRQDKAAGLLCGGGDEGEQGAGQPDRAAADTDGEAQCACHLDPLPRCLLPASVINTASQQCTSAV